MSFVAVGGLGLQLLGGCYQSSVHDDAGDVETCGIETVVTFGAQGGEIAFDQSYELRPVRTFVATRIAHDATGTRTTCTTEVPACDAADPVVIDIGDVVSQFRRPEVEAAFAEATPPLYGSDPRPYDGRLYVVTRADGRGFQVGAECGSLPSCTPIPLAIASLVSHLQRLAEQELARPQCAALR